MYPTNPVGAAAVLPPPLRVLIVEHDAETALAYEILLQLQGREVRTASDGPSALAAARAFQPDVVLLELCLPGLDGWEVARWLRARGAGKSPFLVALTKYRRRQDKRKSRESGIDLHLLKPADPRILADLVERFQQVVR
jgi:CheY-like chemotaxis protein